MFSVLLICYSYYTIKARC